MNSLDFIQKLKSNKKRITPGRKNIIEIFCNSMSPISADNLVKKTNLNKTSVYRELSFLSKEDFIQEVDLGDSIKRYELKDSSHHHHLVCIKCKDVEDVILKEKFSEEEKLIEKFKKFKVLKHNLEFFGYCQNCR